MEGHYTIPRVGDLNANCLRSEIERMAHDLAQIHEKVKIYLVEDMQGGYALPKHIHSNMVSSKTLRSLPIKSHERACLFMPQCFCFKLAQIFTL